MRTFWSDLNPEAAADDLWHSLRPARQIDGCPGAWELKGPPGERARWTHFGVDAGEELAAADVCLVVRVRRHDERRPGEQGALLLEYMVQSRFRRNVRSQDPGEEVVVPALPGSAASLIVTVRGADGHLVGACAVRAR